MQQGRIAGNAGHAWACPSPPGGAQPPPKPSLSVQAAPIFRGI